MRLGQKILHERTPFRSCSCEDQLNGFNSSFWGPFWWYVLHFLAINTNEEEWFSFLKLTRVLMPCGTCRVHFQKLSEEYIRSKEYGPTEKTETKFLVSLFFHNTVSLRIKGPPGIINFGSKYVESFYKNCSVFDTCAKIIYNMVVSSIPVRILCYQKIGGCISEQKTKDPEEFLKQKKTSLPKFSASILPKKISGKNKYKTLPVTMCVGFFRQKKI